MGAGPALRDRLASALQAQNALAGYIDCALAGGSHKLDWNRARRYGDALTPRGVHVYMPCRRCPAVILNPDGGPE